MVRSRDMDGDNMDASDFYLLFRKTAKKIKKPGSEEREKLILAICEKQPELLILPGYNKSYYGYAAELIVKLGYEKFKGHIEKLFNWVQDVNWPAADMIIDFLSSIPKDDLVESIKRVLMTAYKDNDDFWIYGINHVIKEANLSEYFFADVEFRQILEFGGCLEHIGEDADNILEIVDFDLEFQENLEICNITAFDLHFCLAEEIGGLVNCVARWNNAQTEDDKQKCLKAIVSIREGYKSRLDKRN